MEEWEWVVFHKVWTSDPSREKLIGLLQLLC